MIELLGPQAILLDDQPSEIEPIEKLLEDFGIGKKFYKIDEAELTLPEEPVKTIDLLILDLFFNSNTLAQFDAEFCVELVKRIVPEGQRYLLIVLSKDSDYVTELLEALKLNKAPYPTAHHKVQKKLAENNRADIKSFLEQFNITLQNRTTVEEIYGEILKIENDEIALVNCKLADGNYQVRRFQKNIFDLDITSQTKYIKIKITTSPGCRVYEYSPVYADLREQFPKKDYFKDLGDTPFTNSGN